MQAPGGYGSARRVSNVRKDWLDAVGWIPSPFGGRVTLPDPLPLKQAYPREHFGAPARWVVQ